MRTSKVAAGVVLGLSFFLAACEGGDGQKGSSGSTVGSHPNITVTHGLPSKSVCDTFSKEAVDKIIGRKVYTASKVGLTSEGDTTCYYYTDPDTLPGTVVDQINNVQIQWMLEKDALWKDMLANLNGGATDGDMSTGRTRIKGLGDDAIKETVTNDGDTVVGYWVLLKDKGLALYIGNAASVPDAAHRALTKMVIQTVEKL